MLEDNHRKKIVNICNEYMVSNNVSDKINPFTLCSGKVLASTTLIFEWKLSKFQV
jgi:hypothetical protein